MSTTPLPRSKMRKRPPSKRKPTVRPFVIPVLNTPKTAENSPDLEAEDPEAVLGSSSDGSAAASPTKRRRGRLMKGTQSPVKQAEPKPADKRRSVSLSLESGQTGSSRSAGKGGSPSRRSGRKLDSGTLPRPHSSPLGRKEDAGGQGDRPQNRSLRKSPVVRETPGEQTSSRRHSKLLPRRALDFEPTTVEGDAPPTTKNTQPHALRSSTSPPADEESPFPRRMSSKKPYQGNITSFEPRVHSTPVVPSRKAPAGEASAVFAEDLDLSEGATSESRGRPGPGKKQTDPPPVFGDLPTTRHAQRSLLEVLRHGGKGSDTTPKSPVKRPSPQSVSSSPDKRSGVPAKQKRLSFLSQDGFVECPVEEQEDEEEEAEKDEQAATSAAALSSYKELLSSWHNKRSGSARGSLSMRGRPEKPKSGASGSSGLHAPPGGHSAQDAADRDLPSTSRGHRSSPRDGALSREAADQVTKAQTDKKKKKRVYVAIQVYQPEGRERSKCEVTAFDVFLTLAMEVIDEEIEQCQSEEGKQVLEMYKQNIIKETGKIIEELQVYTRRLPELEKEKRNLRALRKKIEVLEEKIVRCVRENGLDIDPYEFLLDEEDV